MKSKKIKKKTSVFVTWFLDSLWITAASQYKNIF